MYIIAEVGQAHDGSLGILHSYIDSVSETGADAIKFQTHIAEAESSEFEPFRINFSYEDDTRFNYWKRMSFKEEQWVEIRNHCHSVGLDFISSPFSVCAVNMLDRVGVDYYKIGSGEVTNLLMLDVIAEKNRPVILSSGMSSFSELDAAVKVFGNRNIQLSILQCTTKYPTSPKDIGLNVLEELASRYRVPVGLSDHSGTIYPGLAAAALGASVFEAHIVFDKRMFGPDSRSSLTVDEFSQLVRGIRDIEIMLASKIDKNSNDSFRDMKSIFEKSLSVNKSLKKGAVIRREDLESKKPSGKGIPALKYKDVVGKKLLRNINKWDFLNYGDLDDC